MFKTRRLRTATIVASLLPATACHLVLPANHFSYDVEGESITIKMLDLEAMRTGGHEAIYDRAFETIGFPLPDAGPATSSGGVRSYFEVRDENNNIVTLGNTLADVSKNLAEYKPAALPALAAPIIGLAVDFAMDFVKGQIQEEAGKYEMQFEGIGYIDKFWQRQEDPVKLGAEDTLGKQLEQKRLRLFQISLVQHYYGFEVVRATTAHPANDPAFRLLFGVAPSSDRQVFLIAPLLAKTHSARVKVLSRRWWTWFPIPYGWALDASDEVQTKVNVELSAIWRERQSGAFDQRFQHDKLMSFTFDLPTQHLSGDNAALEVGGKLPLWIGGWFGSVPISFDALNQPVGNGTGTLRVVVTERDPSNAKQRLEQAAEAIEKHRDEWKKQAQDASSQLTD